MPIALRTQTSFVRTSGNPDYDPAWPGSPPSNGDCLLMVVSILTQVTVTIPAGWTQLGVQDVGSALRVFAFAKVAASEPAGYHVELAGGGAKGYVWLGAYSGVKTVSTPGFAIAASGSLRSHVCPSLVVPANGWLVNAGGFRRGATGSPSTYTINDASAAERLDFSSDANSGTDAGGAVYDSNRSLAAGTYGRTITSSQDEDSGVVMSFALTPNDPTPIPSGTGARWGIHF